MKCIHCGRDSKNKERSNRTCPNCRRKFAFEPREGDPVTDMLFQNAIKRISGDGRLRWGVEHLYYEICRRKRKVAPVWLVAALLGATVFLLTAAALSHWFPFLLVAGGICGVLTLVALATRLRGPFVRIERSAFSGMWDRWRAVHGVPAGVIERAPPQELPKDLEADIGDYSFDRAVVCDRARTVDLLVANNFHFENNCAVLSIDGYPKGPFPVIRAMLKRNPRLLVFVLHDSTPEGCRVARRLVTDPDWFGGSGLKVIDLGLRPRHAGPFRGLLLGSSGAVGPEDGIRPDEADWLSKHRLELAAARPEQVLKRLFAGLQAHANDDPRDTSSGSVTYCGAFDTGGYGGDGNGAMSADGGDGGADAFG